MTTDQQELRILSVALENQQVEWILKDDDISDYIKPIFLRHKDDLGSVEKVGVRALAAPVSDIRNQLIS